MLILDTVSPLCVIAQKATRLQYLGSEAIWCSGELKELVAKGLNMPETTSLTDRFCDQLVESSSRRIKVERSLTVVEEWKTKQHHQNVISFDIKVKTALYIKNWLFFIKSIPTLEPFAKYSLRCHGETKSRKEVQLTIVIKSILSPWDGIN